MSYQPVGPLATPGPIVLTSTPTPSISVSVEYPTPTASQSSSNPTTPTGSADPIYTAVAPTRTATPSVDPVYTASVPPQSSLPASVACNIGQPDGVKNLATCRVTSGGKVLTAPEVLTICQAAAKHSMWQVSEQKYGTELPVDKVERYISICLNGAGLNYRTSSPTVMGYPYLGKVTTGIPALRYIALVGGYGSSEETFLYDATTGKVIDDDKLLRKVIDWNTPDGTIG